MAVRAVPRLPGFRFEAQPPPLAETLPRMDVAMFVGFAAAGPLHLPVVVEDVQQFREIFGDDLLLARDEERGQPVHAYLSSAVGAFFHNGGRRCWVIRVAETRPDQKNPAVANRFPIPGLVRLVLPDWSSSPPEPDFRPGQADAEARSEGSWSDNLRVAAALLSQPVTITRLWLQNGVHTMTLNQPANVTPGDLLRLTFPGPDGETLLLAVEALVSPPKAQPGSPQGFSPEPATGEQWTTGSIALWFKTPPIASLFGSPPSSPLAGSIRASLLTETSERPGVLVQFISDTDDVASDLDADLIQLTLGLPLAEAPAAGSIIRLDFEPLLPQQLWLNVSSASPAVGDDGSPLSERVKIAGSGLWWQPNPPTWLPRSYAAAAVPKFAERLTFELQAHWATTQQQSGGAYPTRLTDLGFAPSSQRYWADLPSDAKLFGPTAESDLIRRPELEGLWLDARHPRFPLSGPWTDELRPDRSKAIYFPLGMSRAPGEDEFRGPPPPKKTALERNGLAAFSADLFLDHALTRAGTETLLSQANFLRYEAAAPRSLTGIHAALEVEEATLIAVPDAVHRGWEKSTTELPPAPEPEEEKKLVEDCLPPRPMETEGEFVDFHRLPAPDLLAIAPPAEDGPYVVRWSASPGAAQYRLEEAIQTDFGDAVALYVGPLLEKEFIGRSEGVYFYRVRAESGQEYSPWSKGQGVRVGAAAPWRLRPIAAVTSGVMPETPEVQKVHQALLRLCAARSDLFAVLALPAYFHEAEALAYVTRLEQEFRSEAERTLSFGALYHPWLIGREDTSNGELRELPPDGAACGMIARRALARGAWIAPANEALSGLTALTPPLAVERRLDLQEGRINIIRQEPRGFLTLSANTLSPDSEIRPIHVRRLLILLRRLALREGMGYVFEPNDAAFRRMVQRSFETLLDNLFIRGAFAGATPEMAYRVETGPTVNTPQSVDAGRLIVELRIAPAQPLHFVTIRLVQTGARGLLVLER